MLLGIVIYLDLISPYLSCSDDGVVFLKGQNITSIPNNLNSSLTYLHIRDTQITTLDLEQLLMYSELCKMYIIASPVTSIIGQSQPSKLDRFQLADANFPVLPDLGDKLSGQLRFCSLNSDGISTIPNDAFIHYIHLVSLSLSGNPIKSLNSSMMNGLRHLQQLYLDNTHVSPLPEVYEWAPELIKLSVCSLGLTELPIAILVNLPMLKILQIRDNNLTTMPDKQYFVNLDSMISIDIKQNQLVCDQRLCWLKVILKFTRLLCPSI